MFLYINQTDLESFHHYCAYLLYKNTFMNSVISILPIWWVKKTKLWEVAYGRPGWDLTSRKIFKSRVHCQFSHNNFTCARTWRFSPSWLLSVKCLQRLHFPLKNVLVLFLCFSRGSTLSDICFIFASLLFNATVLHLFITQNLLTEMEENGF